MAVSHHVYSTYSLAFLDDLVKNCGVKDKSPAALQQGRAVITEKAGPEDGQC